MGNGSWAEASVKTMKGMIENSKNLEMIEQTVSIKSAVSDKNIEEINLLAQELLK